MAAAQRTPSLAYVDHRSDPGGWARALGISREAVDVYLGADVIDLHVDTFIWTRIFNYDLRRRHGRGLFDARFYGQADLPRIREAAIGGAIWSITTNPFRTSKGRAGTFVENLAQLRAIFASVEDEVAIVRTAAEFAAARRTGRHAAFLGIQGGNALDRDGAAIELLGDDIVRVTLVHLSTSSLGVTSAPALPTRAGTGLTRAGRDYVRRLNAKRVFVDLAHIGRKGFFDAVEVHDKTQPLIVTHTGIAGVHRHWRNLDDEQLRAIASTGGTIGVMYQSSFLGEPLLGGRCARIVDHLEHVVRVVGEDFASLGSDWDGMIVTPRDMPTCLELPRLVQVMLDRRWSHDRIRKVLGGNFLRALGMLRP
jgi:membrane dipeptidase